MDTITTRFYTVSETAGILDIPESTLYQRAREGRCKELHPVRVGTSTRFPKAHIDRLAGTA